VAIQPGTYRLGPDDGTLEVRTKRTGAAAKAGHDLRLEVTAWEATLAVAAEAAASRVELDVDGSSLRVIEGTGGLMALGDDEKQNIEHSIDEDVLKREGIRFRSTSVQATASGLRVQGDLTLLGTTRPLAFDVAVADDGRLTGSAVIKQSAWGMKPYSTLFGTLKIVDDVDVAVEARLPAPQSE
jgi:polyisoprenoid-binding protein YceI